MRKKVATYRVRSKCVSKKFYKIENSFVQMEEKVTVCIVEGEFAKW